MTKTEYKDINEAPEENSVLINTPNVQQMICKMNSKYTTNDFA